MKMHRVFLFTFCLVIIIATTKSSSTSSSSSSEHSAHELVDPVDDIDETEEEDPPPPRPIRASSSTVTAATPRKRVRGRKNGSAENSGSSPQVSNTGGGGGDRTRGTRTVQKRRLSSGSFRPTRAPLFEASPPDPFMESGIVGPTSHYGHSHSPPTRDPYYSPSKFERERKRKRIKLASEAPLVPLPQNSFDHPGPAVLNTPAFGKPGKNYAFAYAVGDEDEDFSHKQAKDGAITIGEYRITLPDGRTQVVRYTAGGKHGYKADVTYEPPDAKSLPPAGPTGGYHQQYHDAVQPTHHLTATPASSFNSNRVIKSRPLKNIALHSQENAEYSPASHDDDEISHEFHHNHHHKPRPSPKIRLKAGGQILPSPSPTTEEYLNSISTTPTPRPNSIYDKISPFRGGKYSGSEELAYAHEHSPRAGPARSKSKSVGKQVSTTAQTFYDSPSPSPYPHKATVLLPSPSPTKKYRNHGGNGGGGGGAGHYHGGGGGGHQPQANHVKEYVRPQKHIQYLQETPNYHHNQPYQHHPHPTPLIAKPLKQNQQHLVPLDHYKSGPVQVSYAQPPHKIRKSKKNKHLHPIHNQLGQYLLSAPGTTPTSYQSTSAGPFHYYNSFHQPHHHGYGQISASPTPPVTSVTHSESPYPNAYPVTAFPTGTGPSGGGHNQPRMRLPSPPSNNGHHYLETPASGERPNRHGVKEALARLPQRDFPTPKTTIHPYEVGAVDYGKGVAYGNSQQDKNFPEHYSNFGGFDPTNSLFSSPTGPTGLDYGGGGHHHQDIGYYPNDQFNFLDGLNNYDIEQANVREIRQPRPSRVGGRLYRRVNRTRPDKRRGTPASSSEPTKEEMEMRKSPPPSPPSSSPRPTRHQRQRQQVMRTSSKPPTRNPTTSRKPPPPPTTSRTRGRRRRVRTSQQPEMRQETMMHSNSVESRRPRTRSRNNTNNNNSSNNRSSN